MSKFEKWTLFLAVPSLALLGISVYIQLVEREEHKAGTVSTIGIVVFDLIAAAVVVWTVYRNLKDANRAKKVEITAASKMEEILSLVGKMKQAGGQAALLFCFAEYADDLAKMLEQVWHHWNNAGEKLVTPFGKVEVQDHRSLKVLDLLDERKDFVVLYSYHVGRLKLEVPDFSSPLLRSDQSGREYAAVLAGLKEHAALLRKAANKVWQSGRTLDSEIFGSKK